MSTREDLIKKYTTDLKEKCGITADTDLLTKVTIACGPSIYNDDASTVASSKQSELDTVKNNFLIKKLGLKDSPIWTKELMPLWKNMENRINTNIEQSYTIY